MPKIPAELLDQFVKGPMPGVNYLEGLASIILTGAIGR